MSNETTLLREGERIDDLECHGFRLIQNPSFFCFGIDAVLLSNFAVDCLVAKGNQPIPVEQVGSEKRPVRIVDLGCGNGIIPMLLTAKLSHANVTGLEIQEDVAEMASRSVQLNQVEDRCRIQVGDIKEIKSILQGDSYDLVTCNPPYMKAQDGIKNPTDHLTIARHEVLVNLEEIIRGASHLLRMNGRLCMVHRPFRIPDMMRLMQKYHLEPKTMRLVEPSHGKEANMVLIEAVKGGKSYLKTLPTLAVYGEDGNYTQELLDVYKKY